MRVLEPRGPGLREYVRLADNQLDARSLPAVLASCWRPGDWRGGARESVGVQVEQQIDAIPPHSSR